MDASLVTPARPTQLVDISTIEQQKENIQPLASGRSASQLASLSSHSRSGLGSKLAEEHKLYQSRLDAVDTFERTGAWEDGKDGLSSDDVSTMAEDPLDIHHQYARFVLGNYPAGASATSKLVPLLEASTRRFVDDERYKNDPRYLRLWNLYAKNMEAPEDCYRFLFAKGIGEKLAALYEEFALVLEQAGRRKEADKIYTLGINRMVTPLERIKKRHVDFQERMLHAPPLHPSPPRPAASAPSSTSSGARPILAGPGMAPSGAGPVQNKENGGSAFAIFRDTGASKGEHAEGAQWEDLGTVKSRKRENEVEAGEWKGETLPMASASKPGAFKLEVFRDSDAPPPTPSRADPAADVFTRSVRGPSEAEALRHDPFRNFSVADRNLAAIDPLEGLTVLPIASTSKPATVKSSSSSAKLSSKKSKKKDEPKVPAPKPTSERVACDLVAIYPQPGVEFSFEELAMRRRCEREGDVVSSWGGWEWAAAWQEETARTGKTSYFFDPATSWPLLHDPITAEPLFDFVPRPEAPTAPSPAPPANPSPARLVASPTPDEPTDAFEQSPTRPSASQQSHSLLSPSPPPAQQAERSFVEALSPLRPSQDSQAPLAFSPEQQERSTPSHSPTGSASPRASPLNPRRQPSPTINTRLAANLLDDLWAKTLDFGTEERNSRDSDSENGDSEDEEEDRAAWADIPHSQLNQQSQFTQSTSAGASQEDPPYVPFSQTPSQMDDSMFQPSQSQFSQLSDVQEQSEESEELGRRVGRAGRTGPLRMDEGTDDENDENGGIVARPAPMQLFRDATAVAAPATPGFRPTRAPLGAKPLRGGVAATPAPASAFAILRDESSVPSTQEEEEVEEHEDSFEDFEAPLEGGEEDEQEHGGAYEQRELGDGFAFGRREKGIPSRYAPFIDAMTPVKEATMEYTSSGYTTSSLSTSQRSRRDSAFPTTAPVQEEDEEEQEDSDDEEDDGDRAFVAYQPEEESDRSSFRTRNGSSSEEEPDTEDDEPVVLQPQPPQQLLAEASLDDSSHDWRDSTRKDGQFDGVGDLSADRSLQGHDPSFEASLNTSLPEGYTITGNQSGMTTNMVLAETTNVGANTSDLGKRERVSTSSSSDAVNPFTDAMLKSLLAGVSPPVLEHPSVRNHTASVADNLASLQKTAKRRQVKGGKDRTGVIEDAWELDLGGEVYSVREKLGEGAFGAVFRVAAPQNPDESFDPDAEDDESSLAVKVERPTNLWEFHILEQLHSRLPPRIRQAVVHANHLYAFEDESYLFLDFCDQGSLLDAVNKANESGIAPPTGGASAGLEEVVAMFFVIELVRVVEGFHGAGFIHGDLKIDNCLVRLEEVAGGVRNWATTYDPSGAGGWSSKGVKVIDFGRTIDSRLFPKGQAFVCDFETDEFDCIEMREKRSWTFEPDYFGLASIAFNLLFGRYIETKPVQVDGITKYAINQNFKRYHQAELWTKLFDALLNPKSVRQDGSLPITNELGVIREKMEAWLVKNCDKNGKSLKSLIKKMEIYSMAR